MIERIEVKNSVLYVHAGDTSLKTTKAFTHGGITFDLQTRSATFGKLSVSLPEGIELGDGVSIEMQLVAPDGSLKKQTRTAVFRRIGETEVYRCAGMSKTPSVYSAEAGWRLEVYKFRAYFTHPGVTTDTVFPAWLKASIGRQRTLWNRLAWLCREARSKCTPISPAEIANFVSSSILPRIDELNDSLGRSRQKMKHPPRLKVEEPGLDGLWSFVGELRKRTEQGKPVPEGLLEEVIAFAEQFKPDYTAINDFERNVREIAEREAAKLELRRYEIRPILSRFEALLKKRKKDKDTWSKGWPRIKYADNPRSEEWTLQYYFNRAGVKAEGLINGAGVPGLYWGPALAPSGTGHPMLVGREATKNQLRAATIQVPSGGEDLWAFNFAVLQHRQLPENSHIKQWELVYADGGLWLCLTLEIQRPIAAASSIAAGLDIGWRRTDAGIRFGVLYEPATKSYKELTIDFQRSPVDPARRGTQLAFQVLCGPSRWVREKITRLIPDWKPGDGIPGPVEMRAILGARRSYLKDHAKALLRKELGDQLPPSFDKAGKRGLLRLAADFKDRSEVQAIVSEFQKADDRHNRIAAAYVKVNTQHLQDGYGVIANEICRFLKEKGTTSLVVESNFMKALKEQKGEELSSDSEYAVLNSKKYQHFVAPAKFVATLKKTAVKYGIAVIDIDAAYSTVLCAQCNHRNPSTVKERFQCEGCQRLIMQDHNAAQNLSRFAADPEIVKTLVAK